MPAVAVLRDRACRPRHGRDEPCRDPGECTAELYCDDATYTCVPDLGQGEVCDARDEPCASGLSCPNEADPTCREQAAGGEPCASHEECQSGACYSNTWCRAEPGCQI